MIKLIFKLFFFILTTIYFSGCDNEVSLKPQEMHWDRDMCDRCKMVISERKHAVQVINIQNGKLYKFDDIGCVPKWFKEENISWKDNAKIWVTDVDTGHWIDAKIAFYDTMTITPMAYGFAAHEKRESIDSSLEVVDFNEMSKRVMKRER